MASQLMFHVCTGPVCKGRETIHRLDGDMVIDGQIYNRWVCTECSVPPPDKVARPYQAVDEEGRVLRRWL